MPTTTNYGWTTPADTDLVKDGASAIRTLGTGIDTTVKNLNPETTLGDMSYRSSTSNVNTRLALGTANQQLRVNSGATAPEWFTPAASGGITLLSTTTLSGATTTISSISGSYKTLLIDIINCYVDTNNRAMYISFNNDADDHDSADVENSGSIAGYAVWNDSKMYIGQVDDTSTTSQTFSSYIQVFNYATSDPKNTFGWGFMRNNSASQIRSNIFWGRYRGAAVSSLVFSLDSGTFSAGTVKLYGVN